MFSHIMIGTNNLERAKLFYDSLLGTLGVPPGRVDRHRVFYRTPSGVFAVTKPINGEASTCANGMTIGFAAASTAQADAWHAAGIAGGGTTCEDPPGVREGSRASFILPISAILTGTSSASRTGCDKCPLPRKQAVLDVAASWLEFKGGRLVETMPIQPAIAQVKKIISSALTVI